MPNQKLRMGEVYRYARPYSPEPAYIDGHRNYFNVTFIPSAKLALLDKGINPVAGVAAPEGIRRPAILISSSPHKLGSPVTPWQDFFDPDNGHIRYFGDNKSPGTNPAFSQGNTVLLAAYESHNAQSEEGRQLAVPIVFFRRVSVDGKEKGFIRFEGYGVIDRVELKVQYDRAQGCTFVNYVFDFLVMSLAKENEFFDWEWIAARRDSSRALAATLASAPAAWTDWLRHGKTSFGRTRRQVSKLMTHSTKEQKPDRFSTLEKILDEVYRFYEKRRERFEGLAALIAERVMSADGNTFRRGWVTQAGSDGGSDFIGRLDIGSGLASVRLVVLGQAKCERPDVATGGNHIARTVARLKRGWIGVYVTTGFFSESVQREVIEDQYPILLINGRRIAEEVSRVVHEDGYSSVTAYLEYVDAQYNSMLLRSRRPEEVLLD